MRRSEEDSDRNETVADELKNMIAVTRRELIETDASPTVAVSAESASILTATDVTAFKIQDALNEPTRERKASENYEEKIEIYPSTELIADEYYNDASKTLIHIFLDNTEKSQVQVSEKIRHEMMKLGYTVLEEDIHDTNTHGNVMYALEQIRLRNDLKNVDGLMIFYLANIYEEIDKFITRGDEHNINTKNVWSNFTYQSCEDLAKKPKIFIFLVSYNFSKYFLDNESRPCKFQPFKITFGYTETDGKTNVVNYKEYDVPGEADMLIVYKKSDTQNERENFITDLLDNFENFGMRDDIVNLIARTEATPRALTISTLTKKLYMQYSPYRGYLYDLHNSDLEVEQKMEELKKLLKEKKVSISRSTSVKNPSFMKSTGSMHIDSNTVTDSKMLIDPKNTAVKRPRKISSVTKSPTKVEKEKPRVWKY